ncbi:hypothetical protein IU427_24615 [Nocardia beijingensis]|uniref:hypothetical protein n=1 Tax=Nocardia beijingensis TaxID=95162 RepID=UPI001895059F|nr:hypothetical protein [Nocardia beijingensis]MBF6468329.1 hypothetical protein [Nocardia beijingensis]
MVAFLGEVRAGTQAVGEEGDECIDDRVAVALVVVRAHRLLPPEAVGSGCLSSIAAESTASNPSDDVAVTYLPRRLGGFRWARAVERPRYRPCAKASPQWNRPVSLAADARGATHSDIWSLEARAGQQLTIELISHYTSASGTALVTLTAPDGRLYPTDTVVSRFQLPATGRYHLTITSAQHDASYTMNVRAV